MWADCIRHCTLKNIDGWTASETLFGNIVMWADCIRHCTLKTVFKRGGLHPEPILERCYVGGLHPTLHFGNGKKRDGLHPKPILERYYVDGLHPAVHFENSFIRADCIRTLF